MVSGITVQPRELGRVHECLSWYCFAAGGRTFNALLGGPVALQAIVLPENAQNTAKSGLFKKIYKFALLWGEAQLFLPYVCL